MMMTLAGVISYDKDFHWIMVDLLGDILQRQGAYLKQKPIQHASLVRDILKVNHLFCPSFILWKIL